MRRGVWVLTWRFELEANAQQTERVETAVFLEKDDAVRFAGRTADREARLHYGYAAKDAATVAERVEGDLAVTRNGESASTVELRDGDNLVFGLQRKTIRGAGNGK